MDFSDIFIIVLGAVVIVGATALWFWNHTVRQVHRLRKMEGEVMKKMETRRDVIPYLLEMYKDHVTQPSKTYDEIVTVRARARDTKEFKKLWAREEELEHHLEELYGEAGKNSKLSNDIGWIEAKTELEQLEKDLLDIEERYTHLHHSLELRSQRLPYSFLGGYIRNRL